MRKKLMIIGVCILGCMFMVAGCSTQKKEKKIVVEEKKEELKSIGSEKESDYKVELKNNTGKKIIGVSVKLMEEEAYPENMLKSGDIYEVGESRNLFYMIPKKIEEMEASEEGDKELTPGYDVLLTFEDNNVLELHSFPFDDIKKGEICLSDGIVYLKYVSVGSKEKVETKGAELAIKSQKEEAVAREAEEAARAEAAAQEAAAEEAARAEAAAQEAAAREAAEEAARAEATQQNNANNSSEESDGEDSCLGDGLLY